MKTKQLPKGLAEYRASLSDPDYALELLPRLKDLPESALSDLIEDHAAIIAELRRAEEVVRELHHKATRKAERIFELAISEWSVKQVQRATGYDDD